MTNYSDIYITVLSSKNNAQVEIRFRDVYPTVQQVSIRSTTNDVDYLNND